MFRSLTLFLLCDDRLSSGVIGIVYCHFIVSYHFLIMIGRVTMSRIVFPGAKKPRNLPNQYSKLAFERRTVTATRKLSSVSESYPATQSRHSDLDPGRINVSISALAHGHCYGSRLSDWTGKYLLVCTPGTGTWKPSFYAPCPHEDYAAQSLVLSGPFCASRLSTWPPFVTLCALCSCGHKTLSNVWLIRLCKGQPQPLGRTRVRVTLLHT